MGNHRADVSPQRPDPAPATPYVGKRAARGVPEQPAPTSYVGRRRAVPAEPAAAASVEAVQPVEMPVLTVPTPRVPAGDTLTVPAANPFVIQRLDDTGALPFALTEAFTGSLPRIDDIPGTDFSADSTTTLPVVRLGGKRRRAAQSTTTPLFRRMPSLPILVGVAALAVATTGAVRTASSDLASASGPVHQASALGGTSAVATVGTASRVTVSRSDSRLSLAVQAEKAAAARTAALSQSAKQADARAALLKANQWSLPIQKGSYTLTAGFGAYGLWAHLHTGLDFACPTGTPIHAVANGTITFMGWDGAYGNKTVETLQDGTEIWYAHQSAFGAKVGDKVLSGQVIGYVGATGHVTGPHVHLEVRPGGGDPVDPYPALVAQGLQP